MQKRVSLSPLSVWLVLVAATATTFVAAESGPSGSLLAVGVLMLALLKGKLIALHFMELRHAPALWRWSVLGWLWAVVLGVIGIYLKGLS